MQEQGFKPSFAWLQSPKFSLVALWHHNSTQRTGFIILILRDLETMSSAFLLWEPLFPHLHHERVGLRVGSPSALIFLYHWIITTSYERGWANIISTLLKNKWVFREVLVLCTIMWLGSGSFKQNPCLWTSRLKYERPLANVMSPYKSSPHYGKNCSFPQTRVHIS